MAEIISRYRLLEKLGEGGMGVVYKALDLRLGRLVALKFLSADLTRDPQAVERFDREAQAASALNHPHICTIYDISEHEGKPFLVMEFLEGQTLKDRIARQRLATEEILEISAQVLGALAAAHSKGIIHRDIKPGNLFLTLNSQIKILDFGLAKLVTEVKADGDSDTELRLTRTGTVLGTTIYMSPEQALGEDVDARTDLFSFGVVVYEMATCTVPFQGKTTTGVLDAILHRQPMPPSQLNPRLLPELDLVIYRALEKDRARRYPTAQEFLSDIRALRQRVVPSGAVASLGAAAEDVASDINPSEGMNAGLRTTAGTAPTAISAPLRRRTPLVGRAKEFAQLQTLVDQAGAGQGALVMLGGEAGIGKSRLADELASAAGRRGLLSLTGHCHEMEGVPPYTPFVEIVDSLSRSISPEQLRHLLGSSAPEVAKLAPQLRRLLVLLSTSSLMSPRATPFLLRKSFSTSRTRGNYLTYRDGGAVICASRSSMFPKACGWSSVAACND